jgi:hypothetical protein
LRDLLNSLKTGQDDFTTISAGLASPQVINLGLLEKLKNQKQLTIGHLNLKEMVFFVQKYLDL